MKERPILFSTEMVKAIIAGNKAQTRRIVNPQPADSWMINAKSICPSLNMYRSNGEQMFWISNGNDGEIKSPAGHPGDLLWVRESHFVTWDKNNNITVLFRDGVSIRFYYKDLPLNTIKNLKKRKSLNKSWVPVRFMPKAFCRIWLQNENVKVERLQDITEEDAIAEGVEPCLMDDEHYPNLGTTSYKNYDGPDWGLTAKQSYQTLWDVINPASWHSNPWVWAIKFKVLSTNGKPNLEGKEVAHARA